MNTLIEGTAFFLWFLTLVLCTAFVVWAVARMAQNLRRNAVRTLLRKVMKANPPESRMSDYTENKRQFLEAVHQAGVSKSDVHGMTKGDRT